MNVGDRTPLDGGERPAEAGSTPLGPVPLDEQVWVMFSVRRRSDAPPLPGFEAWRGASRPNPLGPGEFAEQFGAAQGDLDAVAGFARAFGMTVTESSAGRRSVVAHGTAGDMNTAFGIELARYEAPLPGRSRRRPGGGITAPDAPSTHVHRGFEGPVQVPPELIGIVEGVFGLDDRRIGGRYTNGDPTNTVLTTVPQVAELYNYPNAGAAGQIIGIYAQSDYHPDDVTQYFASMPAGYQTPPVLVSVPVTVAGHTYMNDPTGAPDPEIAQDIQIAATVAQGATIAVYKSIGAEVGWLAYLNQVLMPNPGDPAPSVLTSSWYIGDDDTYPSNLLLTLTTKFQELAARGITVFNAQGDTGSVDVGAPGKCHVSYPASDPWVTSCGGTTIGDISGSTFVEVVWNDDGEATGGGVSDLFAVPSYQTDAGVTPVSENDGKVRRGVPDVAANASPNSGYDGVVWGGNLWTGQGTSAVAPLFAGLVAVLNGLLGQPIGFLNPWLYQFGATVCNDIVSGDNDPGDGTTPYYTAGPGWDACTGWGSIDGTKLLGTLIDSMLTQSLEFWVAKSTFGHDEVADTATWPDAFYLVLDGFAPFQVDPAALTSLTFQGTFAGLLSITPGTPRWQDPTRTYVPQRLEVPFQIEFHTPTAAFPASGSPPIWKELETPSITINGKTFQATAEFELVPGADPYFTDVDAAANNPFWLSQDLRVFTAVPALGRLVAGTGTPPAWMPTVQDPTKVDPAAGYGYLTRLLTYLNQNYGSPPPPGDPDPLDNLLDNAGALSGFSSVTPTTPGPGGLSYPNYNFAIARVRLHGAAGDQAQNVKVFFRLFLTSTNDTDYQPDTTYLSSPAGALPAVPLVGLDASGNVLTIPCYASGYDGPADYGSPPAANDQTLTIPANGDDLWAYFGCFLNVYDTNNVVSGHTVPSLLRGTHHCLVAEIAYDDAPIENQGGITLSPANCDKLAQRNLQITPSNNPAPRAGHRVPQTFDLRPSRAAAITLGKPDELMIDWGGTPAGSRAMIYWPQVSAHDVIALADRLYRTHELRALDAHTIELPVGRGAGYVPIPAGPAENLAGLFTIDLPPSVRTGQEFRIVVHRFTTQAKSASAHGWRYLVGSFQITIPVANARALRGPEETTLAIFKWRLEGTPAKDRWHPVMSRYVGYVSGRVDAYGGRASSIHAEAP